MGRDKPIRREDIIVPFAKDLGASIYSGRVKMKNALGFFRRGNGEVRIKRHADLEVTAHEMAHLIDARVPALSREWRNNTALRKELKSVSYDQNSVPEGWAESVRLWMTQPEVLQQRAPMVFDWIEGFVAGDKKYGAADAQGTGRHDRLVRAGCRRTGPVRRSATTARCLMR